MLLLKSWYWLVALCMALMSLPTSAALIRYDVAVTTNSSDPPDFDGHLLFDDAAIPGGDIWPYLAYWEFDLSDFGGPTVNPSNTLPDNVAFFEVDATGVFVESSGSFISFCSTGECFFGVDPMLLSLQTGPLFEAGGVIFPPDYEEIFIGASIDISRPRVVPVPTTLALILPALLLCLGYRQRSTR